MIVSTLVLSLSEADRGKVVTSLLTLLRTTRSQAGCQRCALLLDVEDPHAIVVWEEWESKAHLDRHLRSEGYDAVLAAIECSEVPPHIRFDTVTASAGIEMVEAARRPRSA